MPKKVIVYSADWCPWCHKAMDFLKQNKIEFEMRDVETGNYGEEAMKKSGQAGIPVIDIDGKIVTGFDVEKLKAILKIK
ncbi:MAG: glutaredoxin domain-containing protein [Candidatus ainarchaeum sp.]|nr:glutaredoxin domain-containing protein [Candidatus ainarchaeum sp.]